MKLRLIFELDFPNDRFAKVLQQLVTTYGRLSRREAAAILELTDSSFSRSFRQMYGRSYRTVQTEIRMRIAACIVRHTGLPVHEISTFLGYAEVSKFQQAFRRFHEYPPTAFRKQTRQNRRFFIIKINGTLQAVCKIVLPRTVSRQKSASNA